jgi:hypothetical protein
MATKYQNPQTNTTAAQLPEGFVLSGSRNGVGWYNQSKPGNVVRGLLIGKFTRPDPLKNDKEKGIVGESDFFQVEITQECEVRAESGKDAHMIMAKPGDVVNVNYGPKTKPWAALCDKIDQGASYEVFAVVAGDKLPIAGGSKKMHNILAGSKQISAPQATGAEAGAATDDALFSV